jgi:hypothetical protein
MIEWYYFYIQSELEGYVIFLSEENCFKNLLLCVILNLWELLYLLVPSTHRVLYRCENIQQAVLLPLPPYLQFIHFCIVGALAPLLKYIGLCLS